MARAREGGLAGCRRARRRRGGVSVRWVQIRRRRCAEWWRTRTRTRRRSFVILVANLRIFQFNRSIAFIEHRSLNRNEISRAKMLKIDSLKSLEKS